MKAGVELGAALDSVVGLRELGFHGFRSVARLRETRAAEVPVEPGVYIVVRDTPVAPAFLERSVGGRFRQQDPTVPVPELEARWVEGAIVLYIGRARGPGVRSLLQQRVKRYLRFGQGRVVAHVGGRYIWQLRDHHALHLAWMQTGEREPGAVEAELLSAFVARHGALPFANLRSEECE